jgi:hypothetical protein
VRFATLGVVPGSRAIRKLFRARSRSVVSEASFRRRSFACSSPRTASLSNFRVGYPEPTSAPWGQSEGGTRGTRNQSVFQLNETNSKRRLKAAGVGILSLIDSTQLIDFIRRQKHQNLQIHRSEVHGGYTELRAVCGVGFRVRKRCTTTPSLDNFLVADNPGISVMQDEMGSLPPHELHGCFRCSWGNGQPTLAAMKLKISGIYW